MGSDPPLSRSPCDASIPSTQRKDDVDLLSRIKGMYRLLYLYKEQATSGLVEKVIIADESLGDLINSVCPRAYSSLSKINFKALDQVSIQPVGIYGSKSQIVRLFQELGCVDQETTELLLQPRDERLIHQPRLQSGIYYLDLSSTDLHSTHRLSYVIYWPDDTTWEDGATDSVRRNRTTFMRYLTRLVKQTYCLISHDHGSKLVATGDELSDTKRLHGIQRLDRFFNFEVSKTMDQEEDVVVHPGFSVRSDLIQPPSAASDEKTQLGDEHTLPSVLTIAHGEGHFGFISTQYLPPGKTVVPYSGVQWSEFKLEHECEGSRNIFLSPNITSPGINNLIRQRSVRGRAPDLIADYEKSLSTIKDQTKKMTRDGIAAMKISLPEKRAILNAGCRSIVIAKLLEIYPSLEFSNYLIIGTNGDDSYDEYLQSLFAMHPELLETKNKVLNQSTLDNVSSREFKSAKTSYLALNEALKIGQEADRNTLIRKFLEEDEITTDTAPTATTKKPKQWFSRRRAEILKKLSSSMPMGDLGLPELQFSEPQDPAFISSLPSLSEEDALFPVKTKLLGLFYDGMKKQIHQATDALLLEFEQLILDRQCKHVRVEAESRESKEISKITESFHKNLRVALAPFPSQGGITFEVIEPIGTTERYLKFRITGHKSTPHPGSLKCNIHVLELSEDERRQLAQDTYHPLNPIIGIWHSFNIPDDHSVRYFQFLEKGNKCLLVIDSPQDVFIYITNQVSVAQAVSAPPTRHIKKEGGRVFTMTMHERRRMFVVASVTEVQVSLQMFVFDETLSSLQARGSSQDITAWYQDEIPSFHSIHIAGGMEEIYLVEKSGRIRIFSFESQTFRPATIQLRNFTSIHVPLDGSALIAVEQNLGGWQLRVFHWESFGHRPEGILVDLSSHASFEKPPTFGITSFGRHCLPILLAIDEGRQEITALNLQISRKNAEYSFRSRTRDSKASTSTTRHNSLVNCHAAVWSKYPVVPAIERDSSFQTSYPPSLSFVLDEPHEFPFVPYFKALIMKFERQTRKPTDGRLERICIKVCSFMNVDWRSCPQGNTHLAGEWIAALLCLIPIHIALTRENRFIPLKDGVLDLALEQRLLGADLAHIIDAISLGWYESIFNSYMAGRPVKVISSMGEQSVGKSYTLNHIIDSSFAGSALRTTEGVWLSVCPTKDTLVVALDFEGVHSIERSPQEDMLLILFNTALSNMVIFRNNFTINRNIASMFTGFQSSTSLLDPASNPRLFKSLLTIIIKDVVDGDKEEIVWEFSSKLSRIVSEEQATNFLTVLHASQLTVVPWPVIQSTEFYTLFGDLRTLLMGQPITHASAGEFLLTLKTLMAKLKAQDWASIDQNLTKHRASTLTRMLPMAFAYAATEIVPDIEGLKLVLDIEELKNLDDQQVVPHTDSSAHFYVSKLGGDKASIFGRIVNSWDQDAGRGDLDELTVYLKEIAESRIKHVQDWMNVNISRFSDENADIRMLKQLFDEMAASLLLDVQLCRARCRRCALLCIKYKTHDRGEEHSCGTNHRCLAVCEILDNHQGDTRTPCGLQAGHSGRHLCHPEFHCCGEECDLSQRKGCQKTCDKPIDHDSVDGHSCSSLLHYCGEPCMLQVTTMRSGIYTCNEYCMTPYGQDHTEHVCAARLACPITCELCPRLCATGDHLHGLESGAIHLCGQAHRCPENCQEPGICEINTEPHSVESTFVGMHETFQYTKYTQVARRLRCVIPIPADSLSHKGSHRHDISSDAFHFCTTSCESCGYICTLPLGHQQLLHETAHGSMENTKWAVEGSTAVEILGRRFAGQDGGGPQLCNMVCSQLGRHTHIDFCRSDPNEECQGAELEHSREVFHPNPERPKDWISHRLYWARTGFKDPYSREEQTEFSKCDSQCAGQEHRESNGQASYCTLPLFHPPQPQEWQAGTGTGHISADGHAFSCLNPSRLRSAYHVIFVLDRSTSMRRTDRKPLSDTPATSRIASQHNNRYGAVLSALYGFWTSRAAGVSATDTRRDAYSVLLFNESVEVILAHDFSSNPNRLLLQLLGTHRGSGTNFDAALLQAKNVMEQHWSPDRPPVVVFLSDGECDVSSHIIDDLARRAVALGKPLSLHTISFGMTKYSMALKQMVELARQIGRNAPRGVLTRPVECTYSEAGSTEQLAETFLEIAQSLRNPRASLLRS